MVYRKIKPQFWQAIIGMFKHKQVENYEESPENKKITFTVVDYGGEAIKYAELKELSSLLGTEEIGFEGKFEYGYYDEIDTSVDIYCLNVRFAK